jgi:GNAT superfamily N-acetyltransferase
MHYVARDGGRVVGTGAMFVHGDGAWLGWGGTLRSHRGRGIQSAMVARRIEDARARKCTWLTVETAEDLPERPNPSYRNMERAGFRVLCLRPSHAWLPPGETHTRE